MFDFETKIDGQEFFVEVRNFSFHYTNRWNRDEDLDGWFKTINYAILDEDGKEIDLKSLPQHIQDTLDEEVEEQCMERL